MVTLRPQDVLVLLRLSVADTPRGAVVGWLAAESGLSVGEVSKSLRRSAQAGLYHTSRHEPAREPLLSFLTHGVRHAYPIVRGGIVRGVPTSVSAPPLADTFGPLKPEATPVWPSPSGDRLGYAVEPLYPTLPSIVHRSPAFYELVALTDALREGRARERGLAVSLLSNRLLL